MKNDNTLQNLFVSHETLQEIIRFKHEVLLDINDSLIHFSNDDVVKKYISSTNSSEVHYYLEYHQKIIINFLHFRDENILLDFIVWIYRVYHFKGVDLDIFPIQYTLWKDSFRKYLKSINLLEIENIYAFLLENHEKLKVRALASKITLPENSLIDEIYKLAISSNEDEVLKISKEHCKSIDEFNDFFSNVLSNVMKKVGFAWEISEISVAKEHIASGIIESVSLQIVDSFPSQMKNGKIILLTNAPNEFHGMGLKIVGKILEKKGYKTINLGTSGSPSNDILNAIVEFKPDYVVFGVSISTNLYDVSMIIKKLIVETLNREFKIIVGGSAFESMNNPKKSLNADFYSNDIKKIFEIVN